MSSTPEFDLFSLGGHWPVARLHADAMLKKHYVIMARRALDQVECDARQCFAPLVSIRRMLSAIDSSVRRKSSYFTFSIAALGLGNRQNQTIEARKVYTWNIHENTVDTSA